MFRATAKNKVCVGNTAIAPRSPYPQRHGIIHRHLTAWRGLDSSQDKAWPGPPDTEKQQHCPAPPGPRRAPHSPGVNSEADPYLQAGPGPPVSSACCFPPLPSLTRTWILAVASPGSTHHVLAFKSPADHYVSDFKKKSDTHYSASKGRKFWYTSWHKWTFFPFCTVKSFADYFLTCLQALTWMNLEDIMLMKSAGHKRTHTTQLHLHEAPKVIKVPETGSRMAVSGARGMKDGELVFNGHRVSICKFSRWTVAMVAQQWVHLMLWTVHLKWPSWDFPGGPVAKTPCCQCSGPRFDPWSGN